MKKQVKQFFDLKYIDKNEDIFILNKFKKEILDLEGWGKVSFSNLIKSIENSKNITLEKFIYSLGIRYIGEINSELLTKDFKDLDSLLNSIKKPDTLNNIDGLGPKAISSIIEYLSDKKNIQSIKNLQRILKIEKQIKTIQNSFFNNKFIVFTGSLTSLSRDEAKYMAKKNGAKILSSISRNTDYVIIGQKAGSKAKKAKELNIKILYEKEFLSKINE